jgi:hypothetical protein
VARSDTLQVAHIHHPAKSVITGHGDRILIIFGGVQRFPRPMPPVVGKRRARPMSVPARQSAVGFGRLAPSFFGAAGRHRQRHGRGRADRSPDIEPCVRVTPPDKDLEG